MQTNRAHVDALIDRHNDSEISDVARAAIRDELDNLGVQFVTKWFETAGHWLVRRSGEEAASTYSVTPASLQSAETLQELEAMVTQAAIERGFELDTTEGAEALGASLRREWYHTDREPLARELVDIIDASLDRAIEIEGIEI